MDRALALALFTVVYNLAEGILSIAVGLIAGSVALVGFGTDAFVEALSGGVMVWRFAGPGTELAEERRRAVERRALSGVAVAFVVLGLYVLGESVGRLLRGEVPDVTFLGMAIALASLLVMPVLYRLKLREGRSVASPSLQADARQTLACVLLSVGLLFGLATNAWLGWWWADPLVGLGIAVWVLREGVETWEERDELTAAA